MIWKIEQQANNSDTLDLYIYSTVETIGYDYESGSYKISETSSEYFREQLSAYKDIKRINLYINSMGGSVVEGAGIYNQLKRHPASVTAYIDGFACSIASVIAMSADKVIMPANSIMMIHNASAGVYGTASDMRKSADDLDVINSVAIKAYLEKSNGKISEDKIRELMDAETYLTAEQCIEYGLADELSSNLIDIDYAKQMLEIVRDKGVEQYAKRIQNICDVANKIPVINNTAKHDITETIKNYFN